MTARVNQVTAGELTPPRHASGAHAEVRSAAGRRACGECASCDKWGGWDSDLLSRATDDYDTEGWGVAYCFGSKLIELRTDRSSARSAAEEPPLLLDQQHQRLGQYAVIFH